MSSGWENRYAWVWYNYDEIFNYTRDMMREKLRPYADAGINIIIGFSSTHFRWSFYRYFDKITACIGLLSSVCHELGMKYVEHHSSQLTYNPRTPEDYEWLSHILWMKNKEPWEGVTGDGEDFSVDGSPISSWRQISGKSGTYGITNYHGYGLCFNNPDFKKAYFDYLKTLYEAGIDGIMTDDIQYFGNDGMGWRAFNACTCEHCRRLFREETGYELPMPDGWNEFYGDYKNPVFVAWKRFKDRSTERFARAVTAHYRSLGYDMLRPNYVSNALANNITAYPFECCSELWSCVFQENCNVDIMKESWGISALESLHRYHMAHLNGIPAMAMYYPRTQSNAYFSWALCVSLGLMCTFCGNGNERDYDEKPFIDFHRVHFDSYDAPDRLSDIAFLLSQTTRDYSPGCGGYMDSWLKWAQAALFSGIAADIVFEGDTAEEQRRHKTIVACRTEMPSEGLTDRLREYVLSGGTLVIIVDFDIYGTDGCPHERAEFSRTAGGYGEGEIILLPDDACKGRFQGRVTAKLPDSGLDGRRVKAPEYSAGLIADTGGAVLADIIGKKLVRGTGKELLASLYGTKYGYALHLLNIADKFSRSGDSSHSDEPVGFGETPYEMKARNIGVTVEKRVKSAVLYSPERNEGLTLELHGNGEDTELYIPENTFRGYALIELRV